MNKTMSLTTFHTSRRYSPGFSLVELMVAMVISGLLMIGVIEIFVGTKASYTVQEGNSRLQENARYALRRLGRDISAAGYLGCLDSETPARPFTNDLTNKAAGSGYDFATPLFGSEGTGANGSDTISIRRAGGRVGIRLTAPMDTSVSVLQLDPADGAYNSLQQYDILIVGDCSTASVFMITNDPTTSAGTLQHASGVVADSGPNIGQSNIGGDLGAVYGSDTTSVAGGFRVGTTTYLLCPSISGTGTSLFVNACGNQSNELVEGVQDMQFVYGVDTDTTSGANEYRTAAQVTAANRWNNVVSVRMTLTLDSIQNVPGGALIKPFTATMRLRNRGE